MNKGNAPFIMFEIFAGMVCLTGGIACVLYLCPASDFPLFGAIAITTAAFALAAVAFTCAYCMWEKP